MSKVAADAEGFLDSGTISFSVESRIIRELGERLVKQANVALLELVKNSYDADATTCQIAFVPDKSITIIDDGHGMTFDEFSSGWMRIGTSAKEGERSTRKFKRPITGEKGIGRFSVRFLGRKLDLESIAFDRKRKLTTVLRAEFDWKSFDHNEDLGQLQVPYSLARADDGAKLGTRLQVSRLRSTSNAIDLGALTTSSMGLISPLRSLMGKTDEDAGDAAGSGDTKLDPGFSLRLEGLGNGELEDVGKTVLSRATLRATLRLEDDRVRLRVYRRDSRVPVLDINDAYKSSIGFLRADIRFIPRRKGSLVDLPVDGRTAWTWVKSHSGIAVFDRGFRVLPYGTSGDDWLKLAADHARSAREPRSSVAKKHFPMDTATRVSTKLNYMLRLPYSEQLVGVVRVQGRRIGDTRGGTAEEEDAGLIAAADREGFVTNDAFTQLCDIVRGAVEAIAREDRELQLEQERQAQQALVRAVRAETRAAIEEVESNPNIRAADKKSIVDRLARTEVLARAHESRSQEREAALGVMSLLGVVAGFMTHEFGVALDTLNGARRLLSELGRKKDEFAEYAKQLEDCVKGLEEFVTYSQGYIQGASRRPERSYPVRPRLLRVKRVYGKYADERSILVEVSAEPELMAPLVPVSLYDGISLNLFTNALKAINARVGTDTRKIAFSAWNDRDTHFLSVADTGIGIPSALRDRVFEPLFTTTSANKDPLGSGMGLGLALVKRGVESYGGRVEVVEPPSGYTTCIRVALPLKE